MRGFSPDREEEVIVMQLVKEIYGRENGWDDSTHHSGQQVHSPQQVLEARVVAAGVSASRFERTRTSRYLPG